MNLGFAVARVIAIDLELELDCWRLWELGLGFGIGRFHLGKKLGFEEVIERG